MPREQDWPLMADSIISMDKAYIDYKWLYSLEKSGVFFVARARRDMKYEVIGQHEVNKKKGLLFEQVVQVGSLPKRRDYPKCMRLIGYIDPESGRELVFLTNNFAHILHPKSNKALKQERAAPQACGLTQMGIRHP